MDGAAATWCGATRPRWMQRSRTCTVSSSRRAVTGRPRPALVAAAAPEFVKRVSAAMMAGKGDLLPVSAFPVDGTWPVATSQWEKRNIALEIPVWDAAVCIQCNQCVLACPHAAIRAKRYAPDASRGRTGRVPLDRLPLERRAGPEVHAAGGARGLHRVRAVRRGVPGQGPREPAAQGDRHGAPAPPARGGAHELRLLPVAARSGAARGAADRRQGVAVPPAAVRVLGRMRGLRRDAVREAADAALRRPRAHRERHRLLVDLRRQPANDAVRDGRVRPGPGLVELALRGQRRVRPGLPPGARRPARPGPLARRRARSRPGSGPRRSPARRRPVERSRHPGATQAGRGAQASAGGSRRSASPSGCGSSPTTWSRRASGWWAATAGPTTSASAGSTTCWPADATSTCWCWTRRSTRTRAANRAKRRRWARPPSSRRPARRRPRRTWACWP